MHYIIKLFPEITIKSPPVRRRWIKQLRDNLRKVIAPLAPGAQLERDWEKIELRLPEASAEQAALVEGALTRTPGIANVVRVRDFPLTTFDDLLAQTLDCYRDVLAGKRFAVRVKRAGHHDFRSLDAERFLGTGILQAVPDSQVDLRQPDVTVRIEIRRERVFVVEDTLPGQGGFPIGTQEPVLALMSGGFDSTVAAYLCMKRGLLTHFCFFNLGGRDHEIGVKEVAYYLWQQYGASHRVKFVTVPFEPVVADILRQVDNSYMGVVLKRLMLRAAEQVARELEIDALVTGESIAQVSSQTLPNLQVIDPATDMLVLRPLITTDKSQIIDIARRIGTEPFAVAMPEYCGVISVKPKTRAKRERVEHEESRLDPSLLAQALANREELIIDEVMDSLPTRTEVSEIQVPDPTGIIVDIRHPDDRARRPLRLGSNVTVEQVPFYELERRAGDWSDQARYWLYCDRGVMSRLQAAHLRERGHNQVGVYRPA